MLVVGEDLRNKWHQKAQKEYSKLSKKHLPAQAKLVADDASHHVAVFDMTFVIILADYKLDQVRKLQFIDGDIFLEYSLIP